MASTYAFPGLFPGLMSLYLLGRAEGRREGNDEVGG